MNLLDKTYNPLTPAERNFFIQLQLYLQTKVYFYGSINRHDYYPGKSDIDIDIFTKNMQSTLSRIQHFLHISSNRIRKTFSVIDGQHQVTGYKLFYSSKGEPDNETASTATKGVTQDPEMVRGFTEENASPYAEHPGISNYFSVEISIYHEKDKAYVTKEHGKKQIIPFYAIMALLVLKFLHYDVKLITRATYKQVKRSVLSSWIGMEDIPFAVIKNYDRHVP